MKQPRLEQPKGRTCPSQAPSQRMQEDRTQAPQLPKFTVPNAGHWHWPSLVSCPKLNSPHQRGCSLEPAGQPTPTKFSNEATKGIHPKAQRDLHHSASSDCGVVRDGRASNSAGWSKPKLSTLSRCVIAPDPSLSPPFARRSLGFGLADDAVTDIRHSPSSL